MEILTDSPGPGEVMILVADTGTGVGEGDLEHIFTDLFTVRVEGVGLGLPIPKTIVETHRRRLDMAGCEPLGAVLRFTWPVVDAC